jgi:hypothetical protein
MPESLPRPEIGVTPSPGGEQRRDQPTLTESATAHAWPVGNSIVHKDSR